MQTIKPVGQKLIVFPLKSQETEMEAGIVVSDLQLQRGEVIEVSDELKDLYSAGDTIIFPINSGTSCPNYKGKMCLWITSNIDVWGIVTEETNSKKND